MDITPVVSADRQLINGYGDCGFTITGTRHEGSVIVFETRTVAWTGELSVDGVAAIVEARPEILLIGCGKSMLPIPREVRAALSAAGIKAEPMDTGAACRTYNVLLTEGRSVAAALVAI